jgi:transposase-like protein
MSRHISGDGIVVVETRRRWTDEERREAVNATRTQPVCVVARQRGIARSLLFRWRKGAGLSGGRRREKKRAPAFVPVVLPVAEKPPRGAPAQGADGGLIEIVLAGGCLVRLSGGVDPEALKRVIAVLEGR